MHHLKTTSLIHSFISPWHSKHRQIQIISNSYPLKIKFVLVSRVSESLNTFPLTYMPNGKMQREKFNVLRYIQYEHEFWSASTKNKLRIYPDFLSQLYFKHLSKSEALGHKLKNHNIHHQTSIMQDRMQRVKYTFSWVKYQGNIVTALQKLDMNLFKSNCQDGHCMCTLQ